MNGGAGRAGVHSGSRRAPPLLSIGRCLWNTAPCPACSSTVPGGHAAHPVRAAGPHPPGDDVRRRVRGGVPRRVDLLREAEQRRPGVGPAVSARHYGPVRHRGPRHRPRARPPARRAAPPRHRVLSRPGRAVPAHGPGDHEALTRGPAHLPVRVRDPRPLQGVRGRPQLAGPGPRRRRERRWCGPTRACSSSASPAAAVGGAPAVLVSWLFNADWSLRLATVVFVVAAVFATRIPRTEVVISDDEAELEREELHQPSILLAGSAMALAARRGRVLIRLRRVHPQEPRGALRDVIGSVRRGQLRRQLRRAAPPRAPARRVDPRRRPADLRRRRAVRGPAGRRSGSCSSPSRSGSSALTRGDGLRQPAATRRSRRGAGRAFARFETRFQAAWVVGALFGIIPVAVAAGLGVLGLVLAFGGLSYLAGLRAARSPPPRSKLRPEAVDRALGASAGQLPNRARQTRQRPAQAAAAAAPRPPGGDPSSRTPPSPARPRPPGRPAGPGPAAPRCPAPPAAQAGPGGPLTKRPASHRSDRGSIDSRGHHLPRHHRRRVPRVRAGLVDRLPGEPELARRAPALGRARARADVRRASTATTSSATCRNYCLELTVPGGAILPAAGVSAVTVLATHRRRGLLRTMMRGLLDDAVRAASRSRC